MAELVMADHEVLVELLAHRVPLEPPLKALHGLFPFAVPLILLTRLRDQPKELAPEPLPGERAPGLTGVRGQEAALVQSDRFFELFDPRGFHIAILRLLFLLSIPHSEFRIPHFLPRILHQLLECPYIRPAVRTVEGQQAVLATNGLVAANQLSQALKGHLEGFTGKVSGRLGPERVDDALFAHLSAAQGDDRLEQFQRLLRSLAPEYHGLAVELDAELSERENPYRPGPVFEMHLRFRRNQTVQFDQFLHMRLFDSGFQRL